MKSAWIWIIIIILIALGIWLFSGNGANNNTGDATGDQNEQMEDQSADDSDMTAEGYQDVTVAEAQTLIATKSDLVILDVSSAYGEGHIPGAINYYVGDGSLDDAIPSLDKDKPYLVYCHFDSASRSGAQKLVDAGFEEVYRLEGNYAAWVDAGLDVELP